VTVGDLAAGWLARQEQALSPSYYRTIKYAYGKQVEPKWAAVPAGKVDVLDVKAWAASITLSGSSATVVNRAIGILAGVLDRLAPYVKGVNLGLYHDDTVKRCATCGDAELRRDGEQATTAGVYPLWRCRRCGSLSRAARADRAAVLRPAT
jgi:hypothetical protein